MSFSAQRIVFTSRWSLEGVAGPASQCQGLREREEQERRERQEQEEQERRERLEQEWREREEQERREWQEEEQQEREEQEWRELEKRREREVQERWEQEQQKREEQERREREERREQEQHEREEQERREREREEREQRHMMRILRRVQLLLKATTSIESLLLNILSSAVFIMLTILALELLGWFLFIGLFVTILIYLLLIISPAPINASVFTHQISYRVQKSTTNDAHLPFLRI
ncbi:hypothetical protein R3P38DRAFT_3201361 [Favolaschia claudopus]|uniref:Uncharacterized protein n=1 Tax=Favolaschia claudopus TaxID=2862362 RepID=A0AAW0AYG1_9AGAR